MLGLIEILIIVGIIIYKCNKVEYAYCDDDWFKNINNLRGIMALFIVIGHISLLIDYNVLLQIIAKYAYVAVGFFFFCSSCSMVKAYNKNNKYLKWTFLLRKPLYLLLYALIVYVFSYIIGIGTKIYFIQDFWMVNTIQNIVKGTNWFVWEMIFFYIVFFL